jgi:hypothetical protein
MGAKTSQTSEGLGQMIVRQSFVPISATSLYHSARNRSMVSSTRIWQQTQQTALSVPVQASLLVSLCALTLWTLLFSPYPPIHDALHTVRHHTLGVGCH